MSLTKDTESNLNSRDEAGNKLPDAHVVDWDGPNDPQNPRNWPRFKRNLHVVLISSFTLCGCVRFQNVI
jgi:hypothetical protein